MTARCCWTCAIRPSWRSSRRRAWSTSRCRSSAQRLGELPRDREIHVICRSGQRAYYATRILLQNGFNARDHLRRHAVTHELRTTS